MKSMCGQLQGREEGQPGGKSIMALTDKKSSRAAALAARQVTDTELDLARLTRC